MLLNDKLAGLTKDNFKARLKELGELDVQVRGTRSKLQRHASEASSIAVEDALAAVGIAGADAGRCGGEEHRSDAERGRPSSASSTSSSSSGSSTAAEGDGGGDDYALPAFTNGCNVTIETHRDPGSCGLRIRCSSSLCMDHRCCPGVALFWSSPPVCLMPS